MVWKYPALLVLAIGIAGCNGSAAGPQGVIGADAGRRPLTTTPISHVIFIIQENRSFNNLFVGYPGATTQNFGYDTKGNKIVLHPTDLSTAWDIDHFSSAFFAACDGRGKLRGTKCKMDGWNDETAGPNPPPNFAFAYVPETQIDPYWKIAKQYVVADRAFSSNLDGSFIAHQYSVAAYASRAADAPASAWGCEGGPGDTIATFTPKRTLGRRIAACFDNPSIGSEADAVGVSWRFYAGSVSGNDGGIWSSYQAIRNVYKGPDWPVDVVSPPSQFLTDIKAGHLANVTWITPTYANSDHPGLNANGGPAWIASLVNAVGTSPFWKSSAIFIMWDDWGGWFDPVAPPHEDYDGLGIRVPLLIVSPYAKKNYVSHVRYETSSVLKFIESTFGLAPLAASDTRANDPANDAFDFTQLPRKFKKIAGGKSSAYWTVRERTDRQSGKPKNMIGDD